MEIDSICREMLVVQVVVLRCGARRYPAVDRGSIPGKLRE